MKESTKGVSFPVEAVVSNGDLYRLVIDLSESLGRVEARLERLEGVVTVTVPLAALPVVRQS